MADGVVIRAEGLSKKYLIGHRAERERYMALRDVLARGARAAYRKLANAARGRSVIAGDAFEEFWALKDVTFEVKRGEVLGIIGRNGAGKTTLLKILSRISEPSEGRVTIRGRVASLLEIGTGFHPELTGRENIYLNGAILGMTRAEIGKKFDEIVAFAEIEKFLDTPVKRYSSGMYVRLAFAVAAHLEPEILVIDEVLAVGDAEFQKKCLGKMSEVAGGGRTVLFVSHNMAAMRSLCSRAVLLSGGRVVLDSSVTNVAESYLQSMSRAQHTSWTNEEGLGDEDVVLNSMRISSGNGSQSFFSSERLLIELIVTVRQPRLGLCIGFDLLAEDGSVILRAYDVDDATEASRIRKAGTHRIIGAVNRCLLNGRRYGIAPRIGLHNQKWIVNCDPLLFADIVLDHGETSYWASLDIAHRPGLIAPQLEWKSELMSEEGAAPALSA